jgi:hypothetical protein
MSGNEILIGTGMPRFFPRFYTLFDEGNEFVSNELIESV